MWRKLRSIHEQQSESNKLLLMTRFHEYRMATGDSITQHIAKVENMARQLKDLGETVSDVTLMAKILDSLPSKFNALVTAWDSVDIEKQTIQGLISRLIKKENRMSDESTSALVVASKNKSQIASSDTHKPIQHNRRSVECFYCHKKGHMVKNCRKKETRPEAEADTEITKKKDEQSANVSAFIAMEDLSANVSNLNRNSAWYSDSGASKHMTFQREYFEDFVESCNEYVSLGDGAPCEIKGHGTIHIKLNVNGTWSDGKLEDVLYVPSLNKNLFSVGACLKKGHTVVFEHDAVKISSKGVLKAVEIRKDNNLFQMLFCTVPRNKNCVIPLSCGYGMSV